MKILFSEGSSTSARQTLYALGGRHTIDVCDPQRLALCHFSRFVRHWHLGPSYGANPEAYLRFVLDRLREGQHDVLLPTHDQVYLFSRFRETLRRHAGLAVPEFDSVRAVQNKVSFSRLMDELDLPQPQTAIVHGIAELDRDWPFPCFVKLPVGTAGRGVWKVHGREELKRAIEDLRALKYDERGELVVQQPAAGTFGVIQAVFQRGRLVAAHCYRANAAGAGGSAVARESVSHPLAREQMVRFGAHLNWHGALHAEYFFDADREQPCFIEINPRIGETLNASLSGTDLCETLLRVSLDETVEPLPESRVGVRSHAVMTTLLGMAERGEGRWALLRELIRAWRSKGVFHSSQDELTRPRDDYLSLIPGAAVLLELLASPGRARKLIQGAVDHYGLSAATMRAIDAMEVPADVADEHQRSAETRSTR